jgi:hypothetical protein
MRLWRHLALTRELVALTTVLSAARHYNVTMESRSFHIGWRAEAARSDALQLANNRKIALMFPIVREETLR